MLRRTGGCLPQALAVSLLAGDQVERGRGHDLPQPACHSIHAGEIDTVLTTADTARPPAGLEHLYHKHMHSYHSPDDVDAMEVTRLRLQHTNSWLHH